MVSNLCWHTRSGGPQRSDHRSPRISLGLSRQQLWLDGRRSRLDDSPGLRSSGVRYHGVGANCYSRSGRRRTSGGPSAGGSHAEHPVHPPDRGTHHADATTRVLDAQRLSGVSGDFNGRISVKGRHLDDPITSVYCPGLATGVGMMPSGRCARQTRAAWDQVMHVSQAFPMLGRLTFQEHILRYR